MVLPNELQTIIPCVQEDNPYFIGLSDLFDERHFKRTNWLSSDGSAFTDETMIWSNTEPNNAFEGEDCAVVFNRTLHDHNCIRPKGTLCVHGRFTKLNAKIFVNDAVNIFNNDSDEGCYEHVSSKSKPHCGILYRFYICETC